MDQITTQCKCSCKCEDDLTYSQSNNILHQLESLMRQVDEHWDLNYKSDNNLSKRISKLDNAIDQVKDELSKEIAFIEARMNQPKDCHLTFDVQNLEKQIKEISKALENYREYKIDIEDLGTDVMYLKQSLKKLNQDSEVHPKKKPHKCPVCDGSGNHDDQTPRLMVLVHTKTGIICCNSCEGKGIVWG